MASHKVNHDISLLFLIFPVAYAWYIVPGLDIDLNSAEVTFWVYTYWFSSGLTYIAAFLLVLKATFLSLYGQGFALRGWSFSCIHLVIYRDSYGCNRSKWINGTSCWWNGSRTRECLDALCHYCIFNQHQHCGDILVWNGLYLFEYYHVDWTRIHVNLVSHLSSVVSRLSSDQSILWLDSLSSD